MFEPELEQEHDEIELKPQDPLKSIEAEMSLLGAMLLSRSAWEEALETLEPKHFFRPAHRTIFETMPDAGGEKGADFVTLISALGSRLTDVGGRDYIMNLAEYCPSPENAIAYAKVVLGCWYRRTIFDECKAIALDCMNFEKTTAEVRERASVLTDMPRPSSGAWQQIKDIRVRKMSQNGVSTGFDSLDKTIDTRGYPQGQITIVAAPDKGGKSTFMLSSFIEASQRETGRVGYATFADLNSEQLRLRINRAVSGWKSRPNNEGYAQEYDRAMFDIDQWSSGVYDASEHDDGACIETFAAWLKAEHKKKPFVCFFLDYAQEIQTVQNTQGNEARQNAIVSQAVTRLAAKLKIPLVVGSQLSGMKDGVPMTKWGRVWQEKCGWMLIVQHEDSAEVCEIWVYRSRFGSQGGKIQLPWNNQRLRIG